MKTMFFVRQGRFVHIGLWAAALMCLGTAGCFTSLNPLDLKCSKKQSCPSAYVCSSTGTCVLDTQHNDGSTDLPRGSGGATPSDGSIATDGSGGTTSLLDGPIATGGSGGSTSSPDVPIATGGSGGTTSSPDVPIATGGSGGTTSLLDAPTATGGTDAQTPLPNGSACTADAQCTNSHCIDSFCCATACTACNACSNALTGKDNGTCAPVLSGQSAHNACTADTATNQCGNDGTCDGNGACRKVGTSHVCKAGSCSTDGNTFTPTTTCDGNGACTTATAQDCGGFQCATTGCLKACTVNSDCGAGSYCDTSAGKCAATKNNGAPATNTYECTSGVVADGVCCDKACTGCSACTATLNGQAASTTGQCLPVVANKTAPHSACPAGTECGMDGNCDGNGGCHYPIVGASCGTSSCNTTTSMLTKGACDSTHACQQSTGACPGLMACASSLTSCKPAPCSADADCATGNYCASGTCSPKLSPGSACSSATASQCGSGSCVDSHCCSAASCGTCQSCTGPGGTCVAVTNADDPDSCTGSSTCDTSGTCKKKIGQACTAGTDCMGGNCADGVCCNSTCNGSCEYCNGGTPGTCGYVSGTPKTGHPACAGTGACQGACNATKASCTLPGAETTCRQPSCGGTPPTATNQAVCDGNGSCPNLSTTPCSPFICGATSCLTGCSSSSPCASGAACIGGACQTCPGGQSVCGNGCYNLQSDINHCGSCANSCSGGTPLCVSGGCVQCTTLSDCPTGYQSCTSHTCVCRQKSSTNSVPDAGLDTAANFATIWTPSNSDVTWSSFDADGCPGSGSLEMLPSADAGVSFVTGCLRTPSSSNTTFGFKFWQDAPTSAYCYVAFFSDANCSTQTSGFPPPTIYTSDVTRTWTGAYLNIDSGTNSIKASCFFPQPEGTTVYFDQFYLNNNGSLY